MFSNYFGDMSCRAQEETAAADGVVGTERRLVGGVGNGARSVEGDAHLSK